MEISLTGTTSGDGGTSWVPADACTLPTAERPLRAAEFDELFTAHLRDIERPERGRARLVLSGDQTLPGRLQRLTEAETACCSFFSFGLATLEPAAPSTEEETVLALEIEVPPERVQVLDALVARADRARLTRT